MQLLDSARDWPGCQRYYLGQVLVDLSFFLEARGAPGDLTRSIDLLQGALRQPGARYNLSAVCLRLSELLERRNQTGDLDRAIALLDEYGGAAQPTDLAGIAISLANLLERRAGPGDADRAIALLEGSDPLSQGLSSSEVLLIPLARLLEKRDRPGDRGRSEDLLAQARAARVGDIGQAAGNLVKAVQPLLSLEENEETAAFEERLEPDYEPDETGDMM